MLREDLGWKDDDWIVVSGVVWVIAIGRYVEVLVGFDRLMGLIPIQFSSSKMGSQDS
jgi:hypothetical protein